MEKIKECNKQDRQGQISYSIATESGRKALVTSKNLTKYGGKVEQIKVGDEVNVVFEEVAKKDGNGTWTSAHFPDWEVKTNTGGGSGGWTPKSGGSYKGEDVIGKLINTALMSAVSVYSTMPAGSESVEALFEKYANMSIAKYNVAKQ